MTAEMAAVTEIEINMIVEDDAGRIYMVHTIDHFEIAPLDSEDPPHCKIARVKEISLSQGGIDMHGDRRTLTIPIPAR
jgi:hypothetical protein